MNKKIILLSLFLIGSIFGQTKLQNENIERNKLKLRYNTSFDFKVKLQNGKKIFYIKNYQDESAPGDVKLPSNDIFISLPKVENPTIKFNALSKKLIQAIPEFNDEVGLNKENELVYTKSQFIKNSKTSHFKVKGYLWIGNNYCLHIEVIPAIFISSKNIIEVIDEFDVELIFNDELTSSSILKKRSIQKNIISNINYNNQDFANKFVTQTDDSWIDYTKQYIKLGTAEDGIYRVRKNNLEELSINTTSINPKTFRLLLKGDEIPIYVEGESDLVFDTDDFIEFVGVRNMGGKHRELGGFDQPYNEYLGRYTDTTIYWLTWDGIDGKRVDVSNGNDISSTDTLDYYSQIEHFEKNNWFDFSCASLVRRETPYWIENKTWIEGGIGIGIKNKPFTVSDLKLNQKVNAFLKLQDWVSNISTDAHHYALSINSDLNIYDSTYVNKYEKVVLHAQFSSDLLSEGANTLKLHSFITSATLNNSFLDWYEIEYPRYLIPIDKELNFTFPFIEAPSSKTIKLQNISSDAFSIWQYGEVYKKYNLNKINDEIAFADTVSLKSKFSFMGESKIVAPKIYYAKQFKNLRSSENKADYIAITHKKFISKVYEYSNFISDNYNLDTKVVDIDDIYDEYSYGFFNPEVIKDFLKSTHNNWQDNKPQSVVLIGGATYDYHGNKHNSFGIDRVINYVPSFGASVSDNWFVTWDTTGAYIPQMDIGRIPVTTDEELDWYFEKHQSYVSQEYDDWNKRYMFFSGGNENKPSELNSMRESNQYVIDNYVHPIPIGGKAEHFYKTIDPQTNFGPYSPEYIQNAIDHGAIFISYLGHSGTQTWDNTITNPSQLKNTRNRYPIVSDFGCSTARFAEPDVTSFSQLFTIGNDGQALAYVGNASLGFVSTSLLMPKLFYKKILQENIFTVSKAHKEAKLEMLQTYGSTGIYELFSLTNTLIGDPVLTLPIPNKPNFIVKEEGIKLNSDLLTDLQDSVEVTIKVNNYGSVKLDTLTVLTVHQFQTETDSIYSRLEIPSFLDSINIKLYINDRAGNHSAKVILDPNNKYEEISKDDNTVQITFNVASSSIRPLLQYQMVNGVISRLDFLNPTSESNEETITIDISNDNKFNNFTSSEISFDSLTSKFEILGLEQGLRYWCRTKIKGESNYTTAFSFIPNGEKYFLFDSLSISKSYLKNLDIKNNISSIDTTRIKFEIMSAGFTDGNTALIMKNSNSYMFDATLRGHYITTFKDSTYEFVESTLFDLLGGGSAEASKYAAFLDTVSSDLLLMFAIKDEGAVSLSTEIRNKIKTFGSTLIDAVQFRGSWAFIGKRGATPGTMPEAYSASGDGPVTIDTTISFLSEKGSMLTSEIGPTGKWDKLVVSQEIPSNSVITYTPIGIRKDGVLETLAKLSFQDSVADLSHINSDLYPKLKILVDFTASDDKQSPVLKSLGVDYNDVAELAMNYQVVSVERDSIIQGENNKLSFYIYNVGETKADSVSVKIELKKPDNSSIILDEFLTSIDSSSKKKFEYEYKILSSYGFGDMAFSINVDEDEKITEFFKDNNYYQIPFYVKKDTVTNINSAEIDVSFDGFEIMDGDYVTNSPQILFQLNYSGNFPLEDTSAIRFTLDNKKIYNSQMSIDYDTVNKTIEYTYEPELDDGQHYLRVTENHLLIDDNFGIDKLFTVSNELKALDIYNFPNPASDETDFTFRLASIPEELDIKVYTVAGRLIKIFELQSYDLKADINKIHWDLTDQDGDKIANGVYLYKIILRDHDKVEHYTQKLAIVR